jgi:hypothetical protein
MMKVHEAILY